MRLTGLPSSLMPRAVLARAVIGAVALALLASGCASLEQKEREWTFRVVKADAGWYSGAPASVQEVYLPVGDAPGAQRIHAWWWPAANPDAPVIYYLHGVRWNLTGHVRRMEQLRGFGFSVFAIDYRGFGKSDGDLPSEQWTYEDAQAGWAWVARKQPDPARRFIYGHSLGGAVAIDLAARLAKDKSAPQARGLVVESTFTSLPDIAAELSWSWLPTGLVMTQRYDSIDKVRGLDLPVLFVHGTGDRYVPARFSQALYDAAPGRKKLLLIENGGHNNSMWIGNGEYQHAFAEFFDLSGTALGRAY
ncbi:MAG: alpha/beta fold hydrolase [Burkholderiales bacterium]|nr:alpha/beta fold hydrolase [Burkholderiales bacterium]